MRTHTQNSREREEMNDYIQSLARWMDGILERSRMSRTRVLNAGHGPTWPPKGKKDDDEGETFKECDRTTIYRRMWNGRRD